MTDTFSLQGFTLSQKKILSDKILANGGSLSLMVNANVKYMICPEDRITSYQESQAKKYRFSILRENFIDEWILNKVVDINSFLLFDGQKEQEPKLDFSMYFSSIGSSLSEDSTEFTEKENHAKKHKIKELEKSEKLGKMVKNRKGDLVPLEKLQEKSNKLIKRPEKENNSPPQKTSTTDTKINVDSSQLLQILSMSHSPSRGVVLQLGHGLSEKSNSPTFVPIGKSDNNGINSEYEKVWPYSVHKYSSGAVHSGVVTKSGDVFTWGRGKFGRLGHGNTTNYGYPKKIEIETKFVNISCGYDHTITLDENGLLWGWGSNKFSCLGTKGSEITVPTNLKSINKFFKNINEVITEIFCGRNISAGISESGKLFTWGNNELKLLCHENLQEKFTELPGHVEFDAKVAQVAFGYKHVIVLLSDGRMYSWGQNSDGQLGLGHSLEVNGKSLVVCDVGATFIAAGKAHSGCIGTDGNVYVWGYRHIGIRVEVGTAICSPHVILHTDAYYNNFSQLAFGKDHFVALTEKGDVFQWPLISVGETSPSTVLHVHYGTGTSVCSGRGFFLIGVKTGKNLVLQCARDGMLDEVKSLLEVGAVKPSINDLGKNSLVHFASRGGFANLVQYLLEKFSDTKRFFKQNSLGQTALHLAVTAGHNQLIPILATAGIPLSLKDKKQNSPLHIAVHQKNIEAVEMLIKFGCDLDVTNFSGRTPLHLAVIHQNWPLIQLLAQSGADLLIVDNAGKSVLNYCTPIRAKTIQAFSQRNAHFVFDYDAATFVRTRVRGILSRHGIRTSVEPWRSNLESRDWSNYHAIIVVLSASACRSDDFLYEVYQCYKVGIQIVPIWFSKPEDCTISKKLRKLLPKEIIDLSEDLTSPNFQQNMQKLISKVLKIIEIDTEAGLSGRTIREIPELETMSLFTHKKIKLPNPSETRTIRVFVSSTFKDMKAERDILAKKIFPQIKHLSDKLRVTFTYIDLRWGITDEISSNGEIVSTCLEEVENSSIFISFLGERYGWSQLDGEDRQLETALNVAINKGYEWVERFKNRSVTELEIIQGALRFLPNDEYTDGNSIYDPSISEADKTSLRKFIRPFFYLRHPSYLESLPSGTKLDFLADDFIAQQKLTDLKDRVKQSVYPIRPYKAPREIESLVLEDITNVIHELIPKDGLETSADEFEEMAMNSFAESRSKLYVGRQQNYNIIHKYINRNETKPLLVHGKNGSGKSSLVATIYEAYRKKNPQLCTIVYFIGCTERSLYHYEFCRHVMYRIKKFFNLDQLIPSEKEDIIATFPDWLENAEKHGGILLILDGLDFLDSKGMAKTLNTWLPESFPTSVRTILTTRTASEIYRQFDIGNCPELGICGLETSEKSIIATKTLELHAKRLSQAQMNVISCAPQTSDPSYLSTLLSELCVVGEYETLNEQISEYLKSKSVIDLYTYVLNRLETSFEKENVAKILSFILESRNGISQSEILQIVSEISHCDWLSIYETIKEKIVIKSGLMSFIDHSFCDVISRRYSSKIYIPQMTEYFLEQELTERVAMELPYLYCKSQDWINLRDILTNMNFVKIMYNDRDKFELFEYWKIIGENLSTNNSDPGECYTLALNDLEQKFSLQTEKLRENLQAVLSGSSKKGSAMTAQQSLIKEISDTQKKLAENFYLAGEMCREMAKFESSQYCYERALKIQESEFEKAPVTGKSEWALEIALTLEGLGLIQRNFGEYILATATCERAISLIETHVDKNHVALVSIINVLVTILGKRVKLDEGRQWSERSLAIAEKGFGNHSIETAECLHGLAVILKKQKLFAECEIPLKRALKIRQKVLGPMHSLSGYCYNDLGNLYAKLGVWGKAEEFYKLSQKIVLKVFGDNHPSMAKNLYNIGRALLKQGNLINGLQEIVSAYLISRQFFGDNTMKTLKIKAQIFGVLQTNIPSKYEEACDILRNKLYGNPDVLDQFNIPLKKQEPIPVQPVIVDKPESEDEEPILESPPESPKPEKFRPHVVARIPTEEEQKPQRQLSLLELYLLSINRKPTEKVESSDEECAAKAAEEEKERIEVESSDSDCMAFDLFV